jgi:hypothetical protein
MSELIINTGCPRRNVPNFGRVFLMLKYNETTQNTYRVIQEESALLWEMIV